MFWDENRDKSIPRWTLSTSAGKTAVCLFKVKRLCNSRPEISHTPMPAPWPHVGKETEGNDSVKGSWFCHTAHRGVYSTLRLEMLVT